MVSHTHRIHGAAILYGNMDPINIPQSSPVMLAYIPAPWIRHGICSHIVFHRKTRCVPRKPRLIHPHNDPLFTKAVEHGDRRAVEAALERGAAHDKQ